MDETELMENALREAEDAGEDVPVGCVIEYRGKIIARAHNMRETGKPEAIFSHAEMLCMLRAAEALGTRRLKGCRLAVTLEPCPMCAGAIVQARFDRCVFAACSDKAGCAGSVVNLLQEPNFNHQVDMTSGVMEEESQALIRRFFKELRERTQG